MVSITLNYNLPISPHMLSRQRANLRLHSLVLACLTLRARDVNKHPTLLTIRVFLHY